MADTHSVERHLSLSIADYDREIRRLVAHYDEMVSEGLAIVQALVPPAGRIVDLGTGTGRLAEALARALPEARIVALDVDPGALEVAGTRLAGFGPRVELLQQSFAKPLPPCDAVVASLSLHHIHDLAEKTAVYRSIHEALVPGGALVVLDATVSADPRLGSLTFSRWADAMADHGIDGAAARAHFESWSKEDRYFPIRDELSALARAGYPHPECFWRRGPVSVYGGIKASWISVQHRQ